jgi:predicted O-methyltransferase YrrM
MSEYTTLLTAPLLRYLTDHTAPEDDFLRSLKREAREKGLRPIWIAPEQGSLLQILLRLVGAREVIEVGTLAGYSAIWMARALSGGGRVHTIEVSAKHADFAEKWIAKSDVAAKIKVYRGAAKDLLPKFKTGSADAIFLDADRESYSLYFRHALRVVRTGGLIMADNAFLHGALLDGNSEDPDLRAMSEFNEMMAREATLQSIIVPLGDGLWVAVKLAPPQ